MQVTLTDKDGYILESYTRAETNEGLDSDGDPKEAGTWYESGNSFVGGLNQLKETLADKIKTLDIRNVR